ncbi:MAG: hypothetical protein ABSF57_11635 [Acidobacteriaceae bacterium]|jgi:hypothetical protein
MKWISGSTLVGVLGGTLGVLFLLPCAPVRSQNSNKRCYSVEETFYKIHDLKMTPEIKPIKHCYSDKDHPYRYSVVDIPVSLAVGSVRTPEFSPRKTSWHWILVQVERPLPTKQMACMMAVDDDSPASWKDCPLSDRLLRADWTVWENGKIASSGSSTTHADDIYTKDNIFKFLGKFPALLGKKYVLEVKFTKDGTPLNVANPHLIVTKIGDE